MLFHDSKAMLSYTIMAELTRALKRVSDIAAGKRAFLDALPAETKEAIRHDARISTIGSSTRIENAILTDVEIDWLDETLRRDSRPTTFSQRKKYIENKLSKERERSIEEVAGCRNMLALIFAQAKELLPLTEATLKGLHKELLQFYPPASHYLGEYK